MPKAKAKVSRQRTYEARNRARGLCRVCPKKATRGCFCKNCHKRAYEARRARQGCQRTYKVKGFGKSV